MKWLSTGDSPLYVWPTGEHKRVSVGYFLCHMTQKEFEERLNG